MPDAARILDALERGVLVLSRDLCTLYANARWTAWRGAPLASGVEFSSLLTENAVAAESELRATFSDRRPRTFVASLRAVSAEGGSRQVICSVHRADDTLVVEARADNDDERAALMDVARRLAEATDIAEVLRTLCEIATRQCHASGAAVLRVIEEQGEVVAATGNLLVATGTFFELKGSLLMDAVTGDAIVSEQNYGASNRPLMRVRPSSPSEPSWWRHCALTVNCLASSRWRETSIPRPSTRLTSKSCAYSPITLRLRCTNHCCCCAPKVRIAPRVASSRR